MVEIAHKYNKLIQYNTVQYNNTTMRIFCLGKFHLSRPQYSGIKIVIQSRIDRHQQCLLANQMLLQCDDDDFSFVVSLYPGIICSKEPALPPPHPNPVLSSTYIKWM